MAMFTRIARSLALIATVAISVGVAAPAAAAADSAEAIYSRALGRERELRDDISGGTAQLHQQLVFRPLSGFARAETPIENLYLASASAHPVGAVHGACGANAARAALLHHPLRRTAAALRRAGAGRRRRDGTP